MEFVSKVKRTKYCGDLAAANAGQEVVLMGWVDGRRDHGGLVFLDLRDRTGLVQLVLDPQQAEMKASKDVRTEYVVAVKGKVRLRPDGSKNAKLKTGEIEVECSVCDILSEARPLPFQVGDESVHEMTRLKYRYIDLRSPRMQQNLRARHELNRIVRDQLSKEGFLEIETPILYKSTPEGARDYLVPSRVHLGKFFALPQSPQTLKQLLMISGYDRYFQIARCFRDEDLRADRQPEFTQIDIEMSFVDAEDVIDINERLARRVWKEVANYDIGPIPRITFADAMDQYGSDKPDLRFEMKLQTLNSELQGTGFKVFEDTLAKKGSIKGMVVPKGAAYSRGQLDKLTELAKKWKAKGLVWIKHDANGTVTTPISKFVDEARLKKVLQASGCAAGDLLLVVADDHETACTALGQVRLHVAHEENMIPQTGFKFCWIVDFPLFEYDADNKRWAARHHPFTSPQNQYLDALANGDDSQFGVMLAKAYDLVCNGHELAGGSIRIHRNSVQQGMFRALGMKDEETRHQFGFFLEALQYGTPPHGGIAWGVDRMMMVLCGTEAIREVIAFPKTTKAQCMMSSAPSTVSRDQLLELGIRLGPSAEQALAAEAARDEGAATTDA